MVGFQIFRRNIDGLKLRAYLARTIRRILGIIVTIVDLIGEIEHFRCKLCSFTCYLCDMEQKEVSLEIFTVR